MSIRTLKAMFQYQEVESRLRESEKRFRQMAEQTDILRQMTEPLKKTNYPDE
jgi:hypothetical protein